MIKKGLDKNLIAETTGLSFSEIEKLRKDLGIKKRRDNSFSNNPTDQIASSLIPLQNVG